jgi:hypothetical protein
MGEIPAEGGNRSNDLHITGSMQSLVYVDTKLELSTRTQTPRLHAVHQHRITATCLHNSSLTLLISNSK